MFRSLITMVLCACFAAPLCAQVSTILLPPTPEGLTDEGDAPEAPKRSEIPAEQASPPASEANAPVAAASADVAAARAAVVREITGAVQRNDANSFGKDFAPILQQAMPPVQQRLLLDGLRMQFGNVVRTGEPQVLDGTQMVSRIEFERGAVAMRVVFDAQNKVAGLWLDPAAGASPADAAPLSTAAAPGPNEPNYMDTITAELDALERGAAAETQEWQGRSDNKVQLARSVQSRQAEELNYLRNLAAREGATQTAAAIEMLIARQEKRFAAITKAIEEQVRADRMRERDERRDASRTTRTDRTREPRTRERTTRTRERDANSPQGYPQN